MATFSAVSGVIGSIFAVPRIPSVPKSFRVITPPDFYYAIRAANVQKSRVGVK
jgi:hypothetical protein